MTNLVIDIGNTRTKVAVFEDDNMIDFCAEELVTLPFLKDFFSKYPIDNSQEVNGTRIACERFNAVEVP